MARGLRRHPLAGSGAVVLSLVNGASMVLGAAVVGWATDAVIVPAFETGRVAAATVAVAAAAIVGVSVLRLVTILYRGVLTGVVQFGAQAASRRAVAGQLLRLAPAWHRRRAPGRLMSTAVSDVDMTWQPMLLFPFAIGMVFMLVVAAVTVALEDAQLAAVALTLVPLVLAANLTYQAVLVPRARRTQEERARLAEHAHESVLGAEVLRTLGRVRGATDELRARADGVRAAQVRVARVSAVFDPVIELLPTATILVVLLLGAGRIDAGTLTVGALVEVVFLLLTMMIPLNVISRFLSQLPLTIAGSERIDGVLSADEYLSAGSADAPDGPAEVRIRDAVVRHGRRTVLAVDELHLRPGEVVAVVGSTGSGKTSLLRLAARTLDPHAGVVDINGLPASAYSDAARSRLIGYVPENPVLLAGSVRFNLELGGLRDDDDLAQAITVADVEEIVRGLPDGLDTAVGTGHRQLSGGQVQRLTIARAIARERGLLVLDDVSASLDALTERRVFDDLMHLVRGRTTVLFSASRIAPLRHADRVVFLDAGRIDAEGTHTELLSQHAGYRRLVAVYERAARVEASA